MATRSPTTTRQLNDDDYHDDDDLPSLVSEQQRELMNAQVLESDLDLAFRLQLQEALNASLAQQPSSSSSSAPDPDPHPPRNDDVKGLATFQSEELSRLEQELKDREQSEVETRKMREDLCRRIHDQKVAREILKIPEEDWKDWGDNFEKPFGEGSSNGSSFGSECNFRLYFKGLVSEENVGDKKIVLDGIGVAICDPRDNLIFEVRKPLIANGKNKTSAEAKALIEGLNAALALELKRIVFYCDYYPLFQFVSNPRSQSFFFFSFEFKFWILTELDTVAELKLLNVVV